MTESSVAKCFRDNQQRPKDNPELKFALLCPITGHPCEGDLAYLCEEYGCARKGGLSPHSHENLNRTCGFPAYGSTSGM
jgi:hypothetical protein